MHYIKFFISFVFLTFSLIAENSLNFEDDSKFIDFEAAPDCLVGGAVNVISGHYIESNTDYVSTSANPILIERSYSDGFQERGFLWGYCDLNVFSSAYIESREGVYQTNILENGSKFVYVGEEYKSIFKSEKSHSIHHSQYKKTICNTAPPKLSAKVNLTRRRLTAENNQLFIHTGLDTTCFGYKRSENFFFSNGGEKIYRL